jgi:hypothetical protein
MILSGGLMFFHTQQMLSKAERHPLHHAKAYDPISASMGMYIGKLGSAPLTKPLNGKRKGFRKSRFSKIKKEKGMEIEFFFKNRKRKKGKGFFLPKSKKEKRKGFFLKTRKGKEKCGLERFPTKHK